MRRLVLIAAIVGYRSLPGGLKQSCPRAGASCSQLALAAVGAGAGLAEVRRIVAGCTQSPGKHEPTCDFPV